MSGAPAGHGTTWVSGTALATAVAVGCHDAPRQGTSAAPSASLTVPSPITPSEPSTVSSTSPPSRVEPSPDPVAVVLVPAGTVRGCRVEGYGFTCDGAAVTVSSIAIDATEVTVGAYARCVQH